VLVGTRSFSDIRDEGRLSESADLSEDATDDTDTFRDLLEGVVEVDRDRRDGVDPVEQGELIVASVLLTGGVALDGV